MCLLISRSFRTSLCLFLAMEFLYLFTGLIIGFLIAWLLFRSKTAINNSPITQEMYNELDKKSSLLELSVKSTREEKENAIRELSAEREKLNAANIRLAKAEEAFKNLNEKLATQKQEIESLNEKFTSQFKAIANDILKENSKEFTEKNQKNINEILNPLKEKISLFEKKVEESYDKELRDKLSLREEIKKLVELNTRISTEANNLTKALKGDNKKQGNWGELILEKILERSGLVKDQEYRTQFSTENSDGNTIKPDVVVMLPENKHIIIDSKVSLLAYDGYVNAETDELAERFKKEHIVSIRSHIKGLSEKNYQTSKGMNTPDFVILFIPIESSFGMAVQADQDLFNFAWDKKIVIVSPSTLFAILRTISSIWKQERQNRYAIEIATVGGSLYDEFYRFIEDLKDIEKNLQKSQDAYNSAFKRLSTGKGNLISRAERIKDLGAKATKSIDKNLLEEPALNSEIADPSGTLFNQ
jgi:DNA recombination protein RmuC